MHRPRDPAPHVDAQRRGRQEAGRRLRRRSLIATCGAARRATGRTRDCAITTIDTADFDAARQEGFRTLAEYIFGGNTDGEKLAMTAPVTLRRADTTSVVSFVMPPGRDLQSLPRPSNGRVELAATGERRFAVMTFRRGYGADAFERMKTAAREAVEAENLVAKGEPMFAGFDPPSTLPFLRRTEVWIELA